MKDSTLAKLELDEELRGAVDDARAIVSPPARRRAERALAGELRNYELADIASKIANVESTGATDTAQFHLAERWRTRLVEDDAALAEWVGNPGELAALVANARRERDTGRPAGAKRALFRHIMATLAKK